MIKMKKSPRIMMMEKRMRLKMTGRMKKKRWEDRVRPRLLLPKNELRITLIINNILILH
jgi:hypothetical protein